MARAVRAGAILYLDERRRRKHALALASTRAVRSACRSAIAEALTDDAKMLTAVNELGASLFENS